MQRLFKKEGTKRKRMVDTYIEVTSKDFAEKVLNASQLVLVNFYAEQSSSSQIQEPEFLAISKEYQDRIVFAKTDVTSNEDLIPLWHIDGIPTMVFFKGGNEIYRIKGIMMRDKLRRQIEGVLLAS
jgi:thioredoxin 1